MICALRIDELVLARGCAAGNDAAWEQFLTRFREKMYGAAYSIAKQDSVARELADSLYANLYGMTEREGERLSKLGSYMGRGSLEGWLRTVLAQEYVNRYRTQKRLVSLEEEEEAGHQFVAASTPVPQNGDARVSAAVDEVLANLGEEERYCLAAYFLDDRTLADIARSLGVHESTISRKLEKITKGLRGAVISTLVKHGMDRRAAQEALETDVRDLAVDVRARLGEARKPAPGKSRS
jgi:RNA polymerase sigma-70 factor, ECF subfamily